MPYDGTPPGEQPAGLTCIVVGGCANGAVIPNVKLGAERIALRRPEYIKPLASAVQKIPEIANEEDEYVIHPVGLYDDSGMTPSVVGVAVVAGRSLTWAVKQLISGYAQNVVNELRAAGFSPPKPPKDKSKH